MLKDKNEKVGAAVGAVGTLFAGPILPLLGGVGLWGYGSVEKDKKWKNAGKGVLVGTGIMFAAEIILALMIVNFASFSSPEYQNAAALLAKNGIKVPLRS